MNAARLGSLRQPPAPAALGIGALVVFVAALADTDLPHGRAAAVLGAALVLAAPPAWGIGLAIVAAHLSAWLTSAAVGPLAVVDVMLLAALARTLPRLWTARVSLLQQRWLIALPLAFAVLGLIASLSAEGESAVSAMLRVSTYLAFAVAAALSLDAHERRIVLLAFIGAALGDACAALVGLTETIETNFPIGRYLGTLGDPAQFGVSIAAASALLLGSPALLPDIRVRGLVLALLVLGLVGSATRSAAGAFGIALVALAAQQLSDRGVRPDIRAALGAATGVGVVVGLLVVTVGAGAIGLDADSAGIRVDSLATGWDYLTTFPFTPSGMGNVPGEFPTYNTWLASAVAVGTWTVLALAAAFVASLVKVLRAEAAGEPLARGLLAALLGFALITFSENLVFAGSSLTISWFLLLALALLDGPQPSATEPALDPATPEEVPA